MTWSAAQYVKFEVERTRPARDLIARIPLAHVESAVDLGCGPGNSTEALRERYPGARIVGVDSSTDMIAEARERSLEMTFEFETADIRDWQADGPLDVILANAVLQWLPDHETLIPSLIAKLKPGGVLAVQMPDNADEPSHRLMREVAEAAPWAEKLASAFAERADIRAAEWYFRLARAHARHIDVWRTVYYHPLAGGARAIVEWVKGSGLRPFLDPLDEEHRIEFLARYEAAIAEAYPMEGDGSVILPFPRLFFVAMR
ncbi:MAG TPA: trans-aconitate 2-methyltransferase [Roseiarcus sp.]|nr:trans-aconitate 2-methyltransferase [Roseiarcus sp.]